MSERARALRSCSLFALTLTAFVASSAVAGAQDFNWRKHEGTTIYGIVFFFIVSLGIAMFIIDLLYPFLDPRISFEKS